MEAVNHILPVDPWVGSPPPVLVSRSGAPFLPTETVGEKKLFVLWRKGIRTATAQIPGSGCVVYSQKHGWVFAL
jgi:hypothetical protein